MSTSVGPSPKIQTEQGEMVPINSDEGQLVSCQSVRHMEEETDWKENERTLSETAPFTEGPRTEERRQNGIDACISAWVSGEVAN
jgi:hypothetical protein